MKIKDIMLGISTSVILATTILINVPSLAESSEKIQNQNFQKISKNNISNAMGVDTEISVRDYISVNNENIPLYPTFENKEKAIQEIINETSGLLNKIQEKYKLSKLNEDNWNIYREKMNEHISEYKAEENDNLDYSKLVLFFDIYENDEQNEEIKNYAKTTRSNIVDEELAVMLPYDSENNEVQNFNKDALEFANTTRMSRGYNLTNAKLYAVNHAISPNKSGYGYFLTGDCTNFTSQILEAAGVGQNVYNSEYSGWWHKYSNNKHTYSVSWIRANTFARYMGIGYRTNNHWDFSASLQAGDFIAFDRAGDGDMDHNAFVVDRNNYAGSYNGKNYYDYRVAQHTSNYCAWASSDTNNWETMEDYTCIFARIRR